jgi:hypothetical protein
MSANTSIPRALRTRNLRTVGALAALFVLPLALSFWMYYGDGWQPSGHTNYGELLEPVRPLPLDRWPEGKVLLDKWSLVYIASGSCEQRCRDALIVMRQTRLSLNQEMQRVNRVLIAGRNCCDEAFLQREHAGLLKLDADSAGAGEVVRIFPAEQRADSIFLVDPLGNLVMRYDEHSNPKGLLQDLKKLLKLSHIG